jgi:hypothetical protein
MARRRKPKDSVAEAVHQSAREFTAAARRFAAAAHSRTRAPGFHDHLLMHAAKVRASVPSDQAALRKVAELVVPKNDDAAARERAIRNLVRTLQRKYLRGRTLYEYVQRLERRFGRRNWTLITQRFS